MIEDQVSTVIPSVQTNHKNRLYIIVFVFLGICLVGLMLLVPRQPAIQTSSEQIVSPTPMPFAELTIPYLQKREYMSELGSLVDYTKNTQYTSYTTSYSSDGLKINGLLTRPTGDMPSGGWPAVVFLHGYIPPTLYKTTENYASYVDVLAKEGFVVFKIDLRGHDESEGEPGGAYYSSDYIIDTLNSISALQQSGFVNPAKIGLWGHSMAGNVVMRSVAAKPTIAAAVIWAGAVYTYEDMLTYGIDDNSYRPPSLSTPRQQRRQQLRAQYGDFDKTSPFWKQVAITDYVNSITTPIQVHHAVDDVMVNIGYSRDLMKVLDKSPAPHELFEYPYGGHNLTGNSFNQAMQQSVEFYKKNL